MDAPGVGGGLQVPVHLLPDVLPLREDLGQVPGPKDVPEGGHHDDDVPDDLPEGGGGEEPRGSVVVVIVANGAEWVGHLTRKQYTPLLGESM